MSERTTIGGTVYESVGSSSSNLLLKCNGTARIQWGNKLIDLIKNGKLASSGDSWQVDVISDVGDIKADGLYVLKNDKNPQLWICKNGEQYNITGADLYISASTKQDITVEQQKQALENIGIYYNTLADVQNAGIENGLVYVIETKQLYTIQNGVIEEFEAKLKTVTVEQENEQGEVINSSFRIILSVLDQAYLTLENDVILAHKPLQLESGSVESFGANESKGFRLVVEGDTSRLDVDEINVRNGLPISEFTEITFDSLRGDYIGRKLIPHKWYLITDFQNHWKLPAKSLKFNRPILVRALTEGSFYTEGSLFKDRRVTIHFDINYTEKIPTEDGSTVPAKGKITWMKDSQGNEANFDFLDYTDHKGVPLATLHDSIEDDSLDQSIFPKYSYNNKLTVYDLKGTVYKEGVKEETNVTEIDFQFHDSPIYVDDNTTPEAEPEGGWPIMEFHDNVIDCRGLVVAPTCTKFTKNTLSEICKFQINANMVNCNISDGYTTTTTITSFSEITDNTVFTTTNLSHTLNNVTMSRFVNSTINNSIINGIFEDITDCTFSNQFTRVQFKNISNCTFAAGDIIDVNCHSHVSNYNLSASSDPLLYDTTKSKEVYFVNGKFQIVVGAEQSFGRGMIVMHSGITPIPAGWALCDGGTYTYNGVESTTPNLINRFIKAVGSADLVAAGNNTNLNENNEFTLQEHHLPNHTHPHQAHTHTLSGGSGALISSITPSTNTYVTSMTDAAITTNTASAVSSISSETSTVSVSISEATSTEGAKTWSNLPFKIEPNFYSLIFIMKL